MTEKIILFVVNCGVFMIFLTLANYAMVGITNINFVDTLILLYALGECVRIGYQNVEFLTRLVN